MSVAPSRLVGGPALSAGMTTPTRADFRALAREGNLVPVCREILADLETPVSAFLKIHRGPYGFLLESVEGGEKWGRYSFLGTEPARVFRARGGTVEVETAGQGTVRHTTAEQPTARVPCLCVGSSTARSHLSNGPSHKRRTARRHERACRGGRQDRVPCADSAGHTGKARPCAGIIGAIPAASPCLSASQSYSSPS